MTGIDRFYNLLYNLHVLSILDGNDSNLWQRFVKNKKQVIY